MPKFVFLALLFFQCHSDVKPKPKAYLSLTYPKPQYVNLKEKAPFSFQYNSIAAVTLSNSQGLKLEYPQMKATVYLTYSHVNSNIDSLLNDAYRLPAKHFSKAEAIPEKVFINDTEKVYGTLFTVVGNAASQNQFFLTDSIKHFLVGSLYFYSRPNYDSIFPAAKYIERDLVRLMETLEWN